MPRSRRGRLDESGVAVYIKYGEREATAVWLEHDEVDWPTFAAGDVDHGALADTNQLLGQF